jgi:PleD family two-component response regulator
VIVFSNTYLSNMVQEAWKAGATKCLSKANCTPKQVLDVVRGLVLHTPVNAAQDAGSKAPEAETAYQAGVRQNFLTSMPGTLNVCRLALQSLAKTADEAGRIRQLQEFYRRIHAVTGNAGVAGYHAVAQMADALEALIKELYEKPSNINASTLRTVALAIDFMGVLFDKTCKPGAPAIPPNSKANILVVDDEAISRRAVSYALEKGKLASVSVDNPEAALQMLSEKTYDLIFLDVDMPGMNGFELCTRLRGTARNKSTPVVFVTSLNDFESRANSTISGGNDLIAKPFLFIELTVKALVYLLRGKLTAPAK